MVHEGSIFKWSKITSQGRVTPKCENWKCKQVFYAQSTTSLQLERIVKLKPTTCQKRVCKLRMNDTHVRIQVLFIDGLTKLNDNSWKANKNFDR